MASPTNAVAIEPKSSHNYFRRLLDFFDFQFLPCRTDVEHGNIFFALGQEYFMLNPLVSEKWLSSHARIQCTHANPRAHAHTEMVQCRESRYLKRRRNPI